MSTIFDTYIRSIQSEFDTWQSTEHSFRPALKTLLEWLNGSIWALNESQRITWVGMPDFTIKDAKNNTINIWRIEAKDLYVDLDEKKNKDQLSRYLSAFDNFIYTNNLTFNFYRQGKLVESVSLWTCNRKTIQWNTSDLFADNIIKLERLLKDFLAYSGQTITSPEKLARAMAQKAQLIKYAIDRIFDEEGESSWLYTQYLSFKELLIHDLKPSEFADMYAQTVAYGLFAARLHDPTLPTFSREEAEKLIPKSTPFIRRLFRQMADDDGFDDRIAHIIDDLVHIFLHCDVATILRSYGKKTQMQDPIIHFYETFLWEYDAKMRKARGVYYTPEPVVKFIVKGVDHLLKKEFWLAKGLADTSKIEHTFMEQGKKIKKQVHRVQVLDPATGTGTFLNEVIRYIHQTYFSQQSGMWAGYVGNNLLPRIRWFEILMASYTMAHLKLWLTLEDTGRKGDDRINIYLTNSLEEPHDNLGTLFSQQLAKESEQASKAKKDQPIMVVMGNPPYAVSSSNKWERIQELIQDYKKDLNERKINLDDDYIKFLRYAQYYIDKNGEGIVAMITNNSYIDGITHRQMRKTLLESFDKIYVYDLHGNSKKKETAPDWSKDENVFDIMQGVSIIFAVKTSTSKKHATIYHYDSYGKRDNKYQKLQSQQIGDIKRTKLTPPEPYYFFVPKDFEAIQKYEKWIEIKKLFVENNWWVQTDRDSLYIDNNISLWNRIQKLLSGIYENDFVEEYRIRNSSSYKITEKLKWKKYDEKYMNIIHYKVLDFKHIYYDPNLISRAWYAVLSNMIKWENVGLCLMRTLVNTDKYTTVFCSNSLVDKNFYGFQTYLLPLYLYNEELDGQLKKSVNMDQQLIDEIVNKLWTTRTDDGQGDGKKIVWPEDIFDYIYAVLHSPTYRETYKEFLKIDFPRVPFTDKLDIFWSLVEKGHELRLRHLMEHPDIDQLITSYPVDGDNVVWKIGRKSYVDDKVYINDTQYIGGVPQVARDFYIGWYQPAQKWLKDRKGMKLSYDDIIHYQRIILILTKTAEIMEEIGKVKFL